MAYMWLLVVKWALLSECVQLGILKRAHDKYVDIILQWWPSLKNQFYIYHSLFYKQETGHLFGCQACIIYNYSSTVTDTIIIIKTTIKCTDKTNICTIWNNINLFFLN